MAFLEINSLVKKFSETTALNDVSLRIDKLISKFQALIDNGANHVALLLDDIPENFDKNFSIERVI